MASSPVKSDGKLPRISPKEGQTLTPESSLTWCLAHLCEPGSPGRAEHQTVPSKDTDKRSKMHQWRALVAIRTQHIKGDKAGIARFREKGGLKVLLNLLKHPECSRKVLDLALSILANCCTELETRLEVCKLEGINIVVDIMKRNVALETVQNRAARALGNLAMDPESSALIHSAGGVALLLLCVSFAPSSPTVALPSDSSPKLECAQSAARALLYLSDSPSNRLSLLTQGTLSALAPLIAPEYPPGLRRAALRTLHELTRGCGVECAREVSRSGVLTQLGVMATGESGEHFEELALKTLANVCSQGCLRPLVGSLGVIQRFTEEVKKDPLRSGVFLKALCLCCKEAVNRAKVKENGGLEVLMTFLSSYQNHPLSRFAILACVDFVFDESAMEQLQELGLVPVLVAQLAKLARGEEHAAERADVNAASNMAHNELLPSSCLESFDFPPPEGFRREEAGREQSSSSFLSLRSWLLSEGLISSEGELLDSSCADAEWGSLHPSSSSFQTSSPNPDCSPLPKTPPSSSSAFKKSAPPLPPVSSSPSSWSSSDLQTLAASSSVSPSKFSSSQRRRRSHSAASLAKVSLESPPSVPRSGGYHHPYHPEPWTPESPILLLLSRFSHTSDPSAALVSSAVMSGLLCYLTQHQDPSSRCFRMLCRLSCNPSCLQALVRTGSVALIRHRLCANEDGSKGRQRQTDRVKTKVKQLGDALLNNLRVQCESGFGSGVLTHVMLSGSESDRKNCALSLPFITSNKSLLKKLLLDCGYWETFDLGREGALILEHLPKPTPSLEYLGKESSSQDQEALSISSYKKAVYDLTWEILKEIFAEDPNTDQPQWVKPRQVKSSSIHRVKTSGDIDKIQEFVTEEVLKLYGLTQDENQKTDWQKMLKFGRKKRDRVDHILVQELHEEEAQWVNYDEDELFVKIQLADSIFEALLKDTVNIFTLISDQRAKRGALS